MYLQIPVVDINWFPLEWCKKEESQSLMLSKLMCICATRVVSERVFSSAGYIGSNLRSYLNHENMDYLTFLARNWTSYMLCDFKLVLVFVVVFYYFSYTVLFCHIMLVSICTKCCLILQHLLNVNLIKKFASAISTAYIKGCLQVEMKYSYVACICISPYHKCISLHPGHLYVL